MKHWITQIGLWLALFYFVTINFFSYGYPVKLSNAPYYLPSMIFYNLSTIFLIITFGLYMQKFSNQWLPLIHWYALYAHRAYLSHVFWLYWCWQFLNRWVPQLGIAIKFPLLAFLTIIISFTTTYLIHLVWTAIKHHLPVHTLNNG